jgi:hypothetical protein
MTVAELIELLKAHPADARVVTHGYEGGYDDVLHAVLQPVRADPNHQWYYGKLTEPEEGQVPEEVAILLATRRADNEFE